MDRLRKKGFRCLKWNLPDFNIKIREIKLHQISKEKVNRKALTPTDTENNTLRIVEVEEEEEMEEEEEENTEDEEEQSRDSEEGNSREDEDYARDSEIEKNKENPQKSRQKKQDSGELNNEWNSWDFDGHGGEEREEDITLKFDQHLETIIGEIHNDNNVKNLEDQLKTENENNLVMKLELKDSQKRVAELERAYNERLDKV